MDSFNMSELGIFVGVCSSALVAVLIASQKSKCSTISCCGFKCERRVDLVIAEEKLQMTGKSGLTPTRTRSAPRLEEIEKEKEKEKIKLELNEPGTEED